MEEMRKLVDELNYLTAKYDEGHSEISDKQWDDMYFKLLALENETNFRYDDSPTQQISYEVVTSLPKIQHNHKMLSLDKTKSVEDVQSFIGNHDYVAMAKMDGLTCSLRYLNGKLVTAETRGNGIIGEDITHNAKVIPSIPNEVAYKSELIVDGEIVCVAHDFQTFAKDFKNPRNFAAGSIRLLDANECARRKLTFIAWDVVKGFEEENSFVKKLSLLSQYNFSIVPWTQENITYAIKDIQDLCFEQGYPIDGLVFKFDDIDYGKSLGETSHHFKNAIAYKFYGVLTPIAIYDDIEIDGAICNRASLHNLNIREELLGNFPYKGEKIWIYKANMIIPQISKAEKRISFEDFHFDIPKVCPICGEPTEIITSDTNTNELYCSNPNCEGKLINQINHFLGKKGLDVKGISEATLEKLISWGWVNSILDMYNLEQYKQEWILKPGFGVKSVENNLNAIAASKECQLDKFICAIGIPLIGTSMSKTLAKTFKTWESFRDAVNSHFDFTLLEDFGWTTEDSILKFDYSQADELAKILNITYEEPEESNNQSLKDMKIAITGTLHHFKNRAELEQAIAAAGGKSVSSVTKNTSILINNDAQSNSSKNLTAKKLNIPILTEEEFLKKYLD
jgi:DNA ligase (NAD+)